MTDDQITVKELLIRVEANLKEEIGHLRADMERYQQNQVTRAEHQATTDRIDKDLQRLDRRIDEANATWRDNLQDFKATLRDEQRRLLAIGGFLVVVLQVLITILPHLS